MRIHFFSSLDTDWNCIEMRWKKYYVVLCDVVSLALSSLDFLNLHDLDGVRSSSVLGTHITVHLCNRSSGGQISVLSVHVVSTTSWVVSEPDGKVFNLQWLSVIDLSDKLMYYFFADQYLVYLYIRWLGGFGSVHISLTIKYKTHLITCNDFTSSLLDILQVGNKVPESALSLDGVWSKDFHLVKWWAWLLLGWQTSTNNSVLFKL